MKYLVYLLLNNLYLTKVYENIFEVLFPKYCPLFDHLIM